MKIERQSIQTFLPLAVVFIVLLLAMPRVAKIGFEYKKGQPWKYETLIAPFDFPILKTEAEMMQEKASVSNAVVPYYKFSNETVSRNLRAAESISLPSKVRSSLVNGLRRIYNKGVVGDDGIFEESAEVSDIIYIQKDKRASKCPSDEVYKLAEARSSLLTMVHNDNPSANVDSLLRESGAYELLVPNLTYDKQTTLLVNAEADRRVSPTSGYVSVGQLIVSEGEVVTAEIAQMLNSYKREYESNMGYSRPGVLFWIGNILLALSVVVLLYLSLFFAAPATFEDFGRYIYVLLIFTVFAVAALVAPRISHDAVFAVPFTLCAMLLQAFFRNRVVVPVYIVSLIPLLFCSQSGPVLFTIYFVAGLVSVYAFRFFTKGWHQLLIAFVTFAVLFISYLGFHFTDFIEDSLSRIVFLLVLSSILTVVGHPLIYLFEKIFNLVSNSRLIELCDTSNPLLRQLEQKAPGTFHHSQQVMNMVDAAARAIQANNLLARAGALYHDIGKMADPFCFIENESMLPENAKGRYHAALYPVESARAIINHTIEGVSIAQKHRLPSIIIDFIKTHHGRGQVTFFYNKYLEEGGTPDHVDEFTYPGPRPSTKEQILLMLCDSIEAAARSMKEMTPEGFSKLVDSIFDSKIELGQMEDADISIKELGIVRQVLKNYLCQMYHGRISYQKTNNNK